MESSDFDGAFKKRPPPRAARRRQAAPDEDPDSSVPTAAAGGAKKSGWGDEDGGAPPKVAPTSRRRRAADDDEEDEPVSTSQLAHMGDAADDDDTTAYIPDLEDEEEDRARLVAQAPSLKSSRVLTIIELDEEIDMTLPSTSEIGVDLSVLQSYLMPQEQVREDDVPWDFEHELQSIASEMQREQEERESATLPGQAPTPKKKKNTAAQSAARAA